MKLKAKLYGVSLIVGCLFMLLLFLGPHKYSHDLQPKIGSTEWMAQREEVYAERNRRVQEVCRGHSELNQHHSKGKTFWFDLNDHLAICMHAKVGCSTWKRNMLILSDLSPEDKKLFDTPLRIHKPYLRQKLLVPGQGSEGFDINKIISEHELFKFSFVRHPFERLISCYEDKILNEPDTEVFYFEIVKQFQTYDEISFTTFVDYVIVEATKANCFVHSSNCWINHHFRPYHSNCFYCHVKYDVIGRLEDFSDDMMYIAMKQNLTPLLSDLTKVNRKSKSKIATDNRVDFYMSQLSDHQKEKLFELYKLDFDLFGYDPWNV